MDSPPLNEWACTAAAAAVLATFVLFRVVAHSVRLRRSRASLAASDRALRELAQTSFGAAMELKCRETHLERLRTMREQLRQLPPVPRIPATPAPAGFHRRGVAAWGYCRTCGAPMGAKRICEMPDCAAAWRAGRRAGGPPPPFPWPDEY
jgi:hypothetical protein